MRVLVTGGAGFIGSSLVRLLLRETDFTVVVVDKLTYAGSLETLSTVEGSSRFSFERVDICDRESLQRVFRDFRPSAVVHLAAESHVDRSIDGPTVFAQTNIIGTLSLLEEARRFYMGGDGEIRESFRFLHVSTDEVFGSLGAEGQFDEATRYDPRSPYSATKASSDHLVRAWFHTYGLPILITNCSNNFGPFQFPEKLIPVAILNALSGREIPVYGTGENARDWLFVEDHAAALLTVLTSGRIGETYMVGGDSERSNLEVVKAVCKIVDEFVPSSEIGDRRRLITFVEDRPGHDFRYAVDASKLSNQLGWEPRYSFEEALRETVKWYMANRSWWERVRTSVYEGERLGLGEQR